ncbi:DUF6265 family protein [Nannocystis bainbridge]|uniref:DUF6265 family protein n=1 Tax=Nannocystis bainbridge TaxID=2995303 RepID=A0ABT5DZK6_9BACT|nr:DUF6265 family protein [Nannocystis bainbridge]MDC0719062.1 DUF6265 family protein [Nannocystis bainbridge]
MRAGPPILALVLVAGLGCGHAPVADALAPLCGTWRHQGRHIVTESWRPMRGGLRGRSTTTQPGGKLVELELMTLTVLRSGLTEYHAEPSGQEPTIFLERRDPAVVAAPGERVWTWVNPDHDFPRRIVYRLAGDRLTASVSNPDGDVGQRIGHTWQYRRTGTCAP